MDLWQFQSDNLSFGLLPAAAIQYIRLVVFCDPIIHPLLRVYKPLRIQVDWWYLNAPWTNMSLPVPCPCSVPLQRNRKSAKHSPFQNLIVHYIVSSWIFRLFVGPFICLSRRLVCLFIHLRCRRWWTLLRLLQQTTHRDKDRQMKSVPENHFENTPKLVLIHQIRVLGSTPTISLLLYRRLFSLNIILYCHPPCVIVYFSRRASCTSPNNTLSPLPPICILSLVEVPNQGKWTFKCKRGRIEPTIYRQFQLIQQPPIRNESHIRFSIYYPFQTDFIVCHVTSVSLLSLSCPRPLI